MHWWLWGKKRAKRRQRPSVSGPGLEQHPVHDGTHSAHVAVHQMSIHIERCGHVTVTQPGLNIFGIATTFAECVDRAVPQVMKAARNPVCFHDPLKVVRDKIRVNGRTVRLRTDIAGLNVFPAKERFVLGLSLLHLQKIIPRCGGKREVPSACGCFCVIREDDLSLVLYRCMAYIEGPSTKVNCIPSQSADFATAHSLRNCQIDNIFQGIVLEQGEQLLKLVGCEYLRTLILFLLRQLDPVGGVVRDDVQL